MATQQTLRTPPHEGALSSVTHSGNNINNNSNNNNNGDNKGDNDISVITISTTTTTTTTTNNDNAVYWRIVEHLCMYGFILYR